jgi:predicted ArsR family transcriptional regulator
MCALASRSLPIASRWAGQDTLQQRVEALAAMRTDERYMAEVQAQADGAFLLIEKHCPICAAAVACTGLYGKELEVFRAVLGPNVVSERTEHMVVGAHRCAYWVAAGADQPGE